MENPQKNMDDLGGKNPPLFSDSSFPGGAHGVSS